MAEWLQKNERMVAVIVSSRSFYQRIRNTGPRKLSVTEVMEKSDGSMVHSQDCLLK